MITRRNLIITASTCLALLGGWTLVLPQLKATGLDRYLPVLRGEHEQHAQMLDNKQRKSNELWIQSLEEKLFETELRAKQDEKTGGHDARVYESRKRSIKRQIQRLENENTFSLPAN